MSILPELVSFLRRPVFTTARVPMTLQSVTELFKLLGLTFALALLSVTIAGSLYTLLSGGLPEVSEGYEALSQSGRFVVAAVVLAPLREELFFRAWLGRVWGVMLVMPVLLAFSAVLALSTQNEVAPTMSTLGVMLVMGSFAMYLGRYHRTKRIKNAHEGSARLIFPYVFWGGAIIFALVHVGNYAGTGFHPLVILLVIPQFIVGVILGFVRMRYGLLQAIGFHAAYNGVFVGLSLLG